MLFPFVIALIVPAHADDAQVDKPQVGDDVSAYEANRFREKGEMYAGWFATELRGAKLDVSVDPGPTRHIVPRIDALSCVSGQGAEVCRSQVTWTVSDDTGTALWATTLVGEYQRRRRENSGGIVALASDGFGVNDRIQARDGALFVTAQRAASFGEFQEAVQGGTPAAVPADTYVPVHEVPEGHRRPARNRIIGSVLMLVAAPAMYAGGITAAIEITDDRPPIAGGAVLGGSLGLLIGGATLVTTGQIGVGRYWNQYQKTRPQFHVNP